MYESIASLTAAAGRGEEPAIELLYRRFFDLLYRHARHVSRRDESFCLDVVQEAMLRIVHTIRTVETEGQLVAWLKLVIKSVAYDLLRRERRRRAREAAYCSAGRGATAAPNAAWPSPEVGGASAPEAAPLRPPMCGTDAAAADEDVRIAWLRRTLLELDADLVRLIELRYVHGWTLARIGGLLGLSTGTIDGRLRRALQRIRASAQLSEPTAQAVGPSEPTAPAVGQSEPTAPAVGHPERRQVRHD